MTVHKNEQYSTDHSQTHRDENNAVLPTPLEETIASIWSQVLEIEPVGIHDDFFDLGGHSLLAMQVISALRATVQVELPLSSFFDAPTVAELAKVIEQLKAKSVQSSTPTLGSISRNAYRVSMNPQSDSAQNKQG